MTPQSTTSYPGQDLPGVYKDWTTYLQHWQTCYYQEWQDYFQLWTCYIQNSPSPTDWQGLDKKSLDKKSLAQTQQLYDRETHHQGTIGWQPAIEAYKHYCAQLNSDKCCYLSAYLAYRYSWRDYWTVEKEQLWRTEPEISPVRQHFLNKRREISPDIKHGIYPFRDPNHSPQCSEEELSLTRADVEYLLEIHQMYGWLDKTSISATLRAGPPRRGLDLRGADLKGIDLQRLPLSQLRGGLSGEEWRNSGEDEHKNAAIHLEDANLRRTDLQAASLRGAHLQGADLQYANLGQTALRSADLTSSDLRSAFLDRGTCLDNVHLEGALLADVSWYHTNLAKVNWPERLGDEHQTSNRQAPQEERWKGYEAAIRANRQLALVLRMQGVNQYANRFAYRAQVLERKFLGLQWQKMMLSWLFSWSLFLVSGYGCKMKRIVMTYVGVVLGFAFCYHFLIRPVILIGDNQLPGFWKSLIDSLVSFHGRPIFVASHEKMRALWDIVPLIEALIGLLLESLMVAMLVQRFTGKSGN